MWHQFLSGLSSFWTKFWPALLASGLTAGFLYLLKRRDERRESRKELSAELYIPARRQLSESLAAVKTHERPLAFDPKTWKGACDSGVAGKLKPSLRLQFEALYERTLPGLDKAWKELNNEIERMGKRWDEKFSDLRDRAMASKEHHIVEVHWWNFLTADGPITPIDGLRDGDVLRLWDCFMTPERFKPLNLSVEQFLTQRWHEAARNDAMMQYRELRGRAIKDIPRAVAALDRISLF